MFEFAYENPTVSKVDPNTINTHILAELGVVDQQPVEPINFIEHGMDIPSSSPTPFLEKEKILINTGGFTEPVLGDVDSGPISLTGPQAYKMIHSNTGVIRSSEDIKNFKRANSVEPRRADTNKSSEGANIKAPVDDSWLTDIGLSFLTKEPSKPTKVLGIETSVGIYYAKFHDIIILPHSMQLVYDQRYEDNYFKFKVSDEVFRVFYDDSIFTCTAPGVEVNLGTSINIQFLFEADVPNI